MCAQERSSVVETSLLMAGEVGAFFELLFVLFWMRLEKTESPKRRDRREESDQENQGVC